MPWPVKTLSARMDEVENAYRAYFTAKEMPVSVQKFKARALAYQINSLEAYIRYLSLQMIPITAEAEYLEFHCASKGIYRKQATAAAGPVYINVYAPTVIESGTILTRNSDNVAYKVTEQLVLEPGRQELKLECLKTGTVGNCPEGEILTFAKAIAGVDTTATVKLIGAGADIETDKDLLARYLEVIRNIFHGGIDSDYVKWALSVEGVNRAWVYGCEMGAGSVTIRIMTPDGFPDQILCAKVKAFIDTVRAPTVKRIFVVSPIAKPINPVFGGVLPDSPEMKTAIEQSLSRFLDVYAVPGGEILLSQFNLTFLSTPGLSDGRLILPDSNIKCERGELAVLGVSTWRS